MEKKNAPRPGGKPFIGTIHNDFCKVTTSIEGLLEGAANHKVVGTHYINPQLDFSEDLILSDEIGAFQYFLRIRDALQYALDGKRIPKELAPPEAPPYVAEWIEGE
jgi:hypothetical protein